MTCQFNSYNLKIKALSFIGCLILSGTFAQKARIWEETKQVLTYPFSDPNPLPSLAINKKSAVFYPYFMIDGYSDKGVNQKWKVVNLENDLISVSVLPEVGGKVMGAIEKSTGKTFVYQNNVMKFRAIGIRGPWTSGGIEHNFGLDLGHAPWAAAAVDYITINNPDGSVSCVVGGLDLASRSEWRVKINLPKDKAYFETESMWFNPTPLHHAYLAWENAAFRASDDLQFYFPGNYHIGHDGLVNPWPIDDKGRDLSIYKNNNFGESKSYHVAGSYRNWFGGYWHNSAFGFGHWSSYSDAPGKKLWIWSLAREGAIWEDLLTDNDGQYIEAQSGVKLNQAAERSGYHSPFRQLSLRPLYMETKTDLWFPVKEIRGMEDVTAYGALNVEMVKDSLLISVSPNQRIDDSLTVYYDGEPIFSQLLHLLPMQPFNKTIGLPSAAAKTIKVDIGNKKLFYTSDKTANLVSRPMRTSDSIRDYHSAERLFRMGEEQNAMRNFDEAMVLYLQCIEKEPTHSESLSRIAELYYRQGKYAEGIAYARKTLEYSAYDGSANYIYGILQAKMNNLKEAQEALSIALRTMEYRSGAYTELAGIELQKKDFGQAALYARKALDYNRYNLTALQFLASAYRKLNDHKEAAGVLNNLLNIDPLSHYARFEQYLLQPDSAAIRLFRSLISNELPYETYLEIALQYAGRGMEEEAIKVLEQSPPYPIVYYWLAYLNKDKAKQKSADYLQRAELISPYLVFPYRLETMPVLEWARKQSASWKTDYYLGLIVWNNLDREGAKKLFRQCGDLPDFAPFYLSRGVLFSDDNTQKANVLKDFKKAASINPKEWRVWHSLSGYYAQQGVFAEQLDNSKKAYALFPANPVISIDYAKALLNAGKQKESLAVLDKTLILPQEGAREGHEVFETANLALAVKMLEQKNFRRAIKYMDQSTEWPEKLGEGRPYEPDTRLQDYLRAFCYREMGNNTKADDYYERIKKFSLNEEHFKTVRNVANNYIGTLVLKQSGEEQSATRLVNEWKSYQDSLRLWKISGESIPLQMQWVLAKFQDEHADLKKLEDRILSSGEENLFRIFLHGLQFVQRKRPVK